MCGVPVDSQYFDESRITEPPGVGSEVVLARFKLPPQYCGVLEYFAQFTDAQARDHTQVETPGLEWSMLSNGRPLFPYLKFDRILNPWGKGSFQVFVRLDEGTTVEFVVRGVAEVSATDDRPVVENPSPRRVGGRIVGRYWYNAAYGDVVRRKS
jgi:hypothetical protein